MCHFQLYKETDDWKYCLNFKINLLFCTCDVNQRSLLHEITHVIFIYSCFFEKKYADIILKWFKYLSVTFTHIQKNTNKHENLILLFVAHKQNLSLSHFLASLMSAAWIYLLHIDGGFSPRVSFLQPEKVVCVQQQQQQQRSVVQLRVVVIYAVCLESTGWENNKLPG